MLRRQATTQMMTLYRGCSVQQKKQIEKNMSAGGATADPSVGKPTEAEAQAQVGEYGRLPEYTESESVANGFASQGGFVIKVKILQKYVTKGSGSESGWVAYDNAPIESFSVHADNTAGDDSDSDEGE